MVPFDPHFLEKAAIQAMKDRGFVPYPPREALAQADAAPDTVSSDLKDLSGLPWTSIDNPESRDLDQVEVAEEVSEGIKLYVGIADVDVRVGKGSAIDKFASANSTSVYTGVHTFPMLPERLSFHLTSLLAGERRAAMVIESVVALDGTLTSGKVYPAVLKNCAKLDYPSISAWLDGKAPAPEVIAADPKLTAQMQLQQRLAHVLLAARKKVGALDIDTAESQPVFDAEGKLTGYSSHHQDTAGSIIEELMIVSNRTVARALDQAKLASIRRVVKEPERWNRIVDYAGQRGFRLPSTPSSPELAKFVDAMRATHGSEFSEISLALVKLMGRGEYVAHSPGETEVGHFGLATAQYTHATAPNRRYVDLVNQRLQKAIALKISSPYSVAELVQIAAHANDREASAQKVERQVRKSAAAVLLAPHLGEEFEGMITGSGEKGVYVRIFKPDAEGRLSAAAAKFKVGQRVDVRLKSVNPEKGFIDFEVK